MRKRNLILGASACLAALTMIAPSAFAEPNGPPLFRDLAGVGSDTTQDVLNALSDVVTIGGTKVIASYNASPPGNITTKDRPAPNPCTIPRPSGSGNGVAALRASLTAGNGCLNFARSSSNSTSTIPDSGPRVSLVPFATDGLTYAVRDDSPVPLDLSRAELQAIYNCAPGTEGFRPLLPQFGSGTRSSFISLILGLSDSATFTATRPCVSAVEPGSNPPRPLLENTGVLLTDPRHIAPYSAAQYDSQINDVIPDVHGRTILGAVDAAVPNVRNNPAAGTATYAIRDDSPVPSDLSRAELRAIFNCAPGTESFDPLLPLPGQSSRVAFLQQILGLPGDDPNFEATRPCIRRLDHNNRGILVTRPSEIAPYEIDVYLRQVNRVIPDEHGRTVLGSTDAISPFVLNPAQPGARTVFNVIPTGQEAVAPTSTVFVGPGSLVCSNPNTITRLGFALLPAGQCGVITIRRGV